MHVHGNHSSLAPLIESRAIARTDASRRAADVRKKLMSRAQEETVFVDALADDVHFEEKHEDAPPQQKRRSQALGRFRAANVSEDESALEERTSLWA